MSELSGLNVRLFFMSSRYEDRATYSFCPSKDRPHLNSQLTEGISREPKISTFFITKIFFGILLEKTYKSLLTTSLSLF